MTDDIKNPFGYYLDHWYDLRDAIVLCFTKNSNGEFSLKTTKEIF